MSNFRFSGHETFVVRSFWPKKGYDFIKSGGKFSDDDAVVKLGVGKNMVSSINFWMQALGLYDSKEGELTKLAHFLFGENGVDPYLEDIASIWLLHYSLITSNYASIYNLIFNHFRKEKTVFTKKQMFSFIENKVGDEIGDLNENTIDKDIQVFLRLYNTPDYNLVKKDFEDELGSLMLDLELLKSQVLSYGEDTKKKEEWYYLTPGSRTSLPELVTFFTILDQNPDSDNIAFRRLEIEPNNPGLCFLLTREGLYKQIKAIEERYEDVVVSETAGNVVFTLGGKEFDKWEILRRHYEN